MQFDLRKTLHGVRHREEVSSLLQTTVAANADCHVGCAGPPSTRSDLARLNLRPALRQMGIPTGVKTQPYTRLESNDGPARLPPKRCGLCVCCILIVLGLIGALAYAALKPPIDDPVASPPAPPYEFTPLWGKLSRSGGAGKGAARHSVRRAPPPPPPAAAPELELDILEHGTGE